MSVFKDELLNKEIKSQMMHAKTWDCEAAIILCEQIVDYEELSLKKSLSSYIFQVDCSFWAWSLSMSCIHFEHWSWLMFILSADIHIVWSVHFASTLQITWHFTVFWPDVALLFTIIRVWNPPLLEFLQGAVTKTVTRKICNVVFNVVHS